MMADLSSKIAEADSGFSCRICKSFAEEDLIESPCLCKGSMGYVHFGCLERWLNQSSRDHCELCLKRLPASCRRRYGLARSVLVWASDPVHRAYLFYDLVIAALLTALTAIIVLIGLVGAGLFASGEQRSLQDPFARVVVLLFMFILVSSYVTTLYLIVQDHVRPWYHWWRHCVNVTLNLDPALLRPAVAKVSHTAASNSLTMVCKQSSEMLTIEDSTSSIFVAKGKTSRIIDQITDAQIV